MYAYLTLRRDTAMIVLVAAVFILAVVYSVFSASTLSGTQLGVGTTTPGAALSVRGGLLVAGGDAQILGPIKVSFLLATSSTASSFVGNVGVGTTTVSRVLTVDTGDLFVRGGTDILGNLTVSNITATGTISLAGGSASAPSYTFTGDTNNGIFSSAADTLDFTTAGVRRVRIDSSGLFGIATGTPGTALSVTGAGVFTGHVTATQFIATSTTATSSIAYGLTVTTSGGTFGVGTSTPSAEVGIAGDVFQASGGTTTISSYSTSATQGGCIELEISGREGVYARIIANPDGSLNAAVGRCQ